MAEEKRYLIWQFTFFSSLFARHRLLTIFSRLGSFLKLIDIVSIPLSPMALLFMEKRDRGRAGILSSSNNEDVPCLLQRRTRSCPATKTFPHWNSRWTTFAKSFFVIAIHPRKEVCFHSVSHWNTQKFTQENWYKICCKAPPKQAAGPVQHHSPSVVSSVFPLPLKGQKGFGGKKIKLRTERYFPLFSPQIPAITFGEVQFSIGQPLLKASSAALSCLFSPHLVPSTSFRRLFSAACRALVFFSEPWRNVTFSALKAASRLFYFWNWYVFSSHISFSPFLDFIPPPSSIWPAFIWVTSVDARNPQ